MKAADVHSANYRGAAEFCWIVTKVSVTEQTALTVHPDRVTVLVCACQDAIIIKKAIPPFSFSHNMVISHPDVVFYRESDTISG